MANLVKTLSYLTCGAVCSILVTAPTPSVSALTITSTVPQSGNNQLTNPTAPLSGPTTPYNYTGNGGYQILTSIDSIRVSLTLEDGDTAQGLGNPDFNNLFLLLDGINTGIALNGFANNRTLTLSLTGTSNPSDNLPLNNAAGILAALKTDGRLAGSIIDNTPNNNDSIRRIAREFTTTLEITGQAVPFEVSPGLGSLVLGAWGAIAYFKTNGRKRKSSGSTFSKN